MRGKLTDEEKCSGGGVADPLKGGNCLIGQNGPHGQTDGSVPWLSSGSTGTGIEGTTVMARRGPWARGPGRRRGTRGPAGASATERGGGWGPGDRRRDTMDLIFANYDPDSNRS